MKLRNSAPRKARPRLSDAANLDEAYREMAADKEREREATEWSESLIADVADDA